MPNIMIFEIKLYTYLTHKNVLTLKYIFNFEFKVKISVLY
jgi:hypothetical protein